MREMKNGLAFILLFKCRDQRGIVAEISNFIFAHSGNIVCADQYSTDPEGGHFFMRVEFTVGDGRYDKIALEAELAPLAAKFGASFQLYERHQLLRMGVLVSSLDHCLVDILYLWRSGELAVKIPFVASNCQQHRKVVEQYDIPFHYIPATKEDTKEGELLSLALAESDFLVLARYMLVLSPEFLSSYGRDIINIHHGFLPSFKGAHPYRQALEKGVKVIGATAHFVTEVLDEGPIIAQAVEQVSHKDGLKALVRKGKNLEKRALADALRSYVDYRVIKHGNKTIVF